MKPMKLEMAAFGSYSEKTLIDFCKLDQGLYLITGDTGAGKTTIFDAIMFALYGEASGVSNGNAADKSRTFEMMHCDYVDKSEDTVVTLTFEHAGKTHTVERCHHFKKKRDTGEYEKTTPTAKFREAGKDVIEKTDAVTRRIEELLGMDAEQFRRIVMLAQGEFKKFLEADSEKKNEILGELFDSSAYVYFQRLFDEARKKLEKRRKEEGYDKISRALEAFLRPEGLSLEEDVFFAEHSGLEKGLFDLVKKDEERKKNLEDQDKKYLRQQNELHKKSGKAEADNKMLDELVEKEADLKVLLTHEDDMKKLKEQIRKVEKAFHGVKPKEDAFNAARNIYESTEKTTEELNKQISKLEKDRDEKKIKFNECEKGNEAKIRQLQKAVERLKDAIEQYSNLEKLAKDEACLKTEKETLRHLTMEARNAEQAYHGMYQAFINGQAGLLAKELEEELRENEEASCPVCRTRFHVSDSHSFAPFVEGTPVQAEVDGAKTEFDEKEKNRAEQAEKVNRLEGKLKGSKEQIEGRLTKLLNGLEISSKEAAEKKKEELEKETDKRAKQIEEAQAAYDVVDGQYREMSGKLKSNQESLPGFKTDMDYAQKLLKETLCQSGFGTLEEVHEILNLAGTADSDIENWITSETRKVTKFDNDLQNTKSRIEELKKETKELERTDLEELQRQISGVEKSRGENLNQLNTCLKQHDNHKKTAVEVSAAKDLLKTTDAAWNRLNSLADLAAGTNAAGGKLSFDRYVMGYVFREVLEMANRRLDIMSGGRYELIHEINAKRDNAKAGLEISVMDMATGKKRPSSSLSGGESFFVSLALALGLSDVVQNHAGGKQLDALFIDEGFGTLDSDVLDKALSVLNQLTEGRRLVGIISHVDKLKESIPQQIRVKRGARGSLVEIVK